MSNVIVVFKESASSFGERRLSLAGAAQAAEAYVSDPPKVKLSCNIVRVLHDTLLRRHEVERQRQIANEARAELGEAERVMRLSTMETVKEVLGAAPDVYAGLRAVVEAEERLGEVQDLKDCGTATMRQLRVARRALNGPEGLEFWDRIPGNDAFSVLSHGDTLDAAREIETLAQMLGHFEEKLAGGETCFKESAFHLDLRKAAYSDRSSHPTALEQFQKIKDEKKVLEKIEPKLLEIAESLEEEVEGAKRDLGCKRGAALEICLNGVGAALGPSGRVLSDALKAFPVEELFSKEMIGDLRRPMGMTPRGEMTLRGGACGLG
jgi:hypothetical protein